MKSAVLLCGSVLGLSTSPGLGQAIWSDDLEAYDVGDRLFDVNQWTSWDGTVERAGEVSDERTFGGARSLKVDFYEVVLDE
jgi:hypothetical protein